MLNELPEAPLDQAEVQPVQPEAVVPAPEVVEAEPILRLAVHGPCKNPNGNYVGLNKAQRDKLGVVEGETVVLKADGKVVGYYVVGKGSKEIADQSGAFTANGVDVGAVVEVQKAGDLSENLVTLPFAVDAEKGERHAARSEKIKNRFAGQDGETYCVVPTALFNKMAIEGDVQSARPTMGAISIGKVKIGGVEKSIPIVPSGTAFSLTSKAAKEFSVPAGVGTHADFFVNKEGMLVLNSFQ